MQTEDMTITACLVVHDDISDLPELLTSLFGQTRKICQFVFCLTGTAGPARAAITERLPDAVIIERPDNPGFSGGINACLHESRSEFVLILNPDVVLQPNYVELCLRVFVEEKRVAGVGGLLLRLAGQDDRKEIDSAGFVVQPWLRLIDRSAGSSDLTQYQDREDVVGVCAAAAVFSTEALESIVEDEMIMDEDFWMYKEDQDLCLRLGEVGFRIVFEPQALAHHSRGWAPGRRFAVPLELRRHSLKNRYLILAKHWRIRVHGWTLPVLVLFEVGLFCALCCRDPRALKGYLLALKLLPKMRTQRRHLSLRLARRRKRTGENRPRIFVTA